jgi:hypothetical protein
VFAATAWFPAPARNCVTVRSGSLRGRKDVALVRRAARDRDMGFPAIEATARRLTPRI